MQGKLLSWWCVLYSLWYASALATPEPQCQTLATRYQQKLQQNLMRLASIADAQPPPAATNEQGTAAAGQLAAQPQ